MTVSYKSLGIIFSIIGLSACTSYNPNGYTNYQTYTDHGIELYPQGYEEGPSQADYQLYNQPTKSAVLVPQTYYSGGNKTPVSHDDVDKSWVTQQRPTEYTIQVKQAEKPSEVAKTLFETPKSARSAQIKSEANGKINYKGVYGTYPTKESAEEALKQLPPSLQSDAQVTTWGNVQSTATP